MFCGKCGNQVPANANVCPYCGTPTGQNSGNGQGGYMPGVQQRAYSPPKQRGRIDNIFSALVHEKTTGAILEFSLWCAVCVLALLAFLAAVTVHGYYLRNDVVNNYIVFWLFVMFIELALGTGMAFRKIKPITILSGTAVFHLIIVIPYYLLFTEVIDRMIDEIPGILIGLFILIILTGMAAVACAAIHFFSKFDLGRVIAILSMVSAFLIIILALCLYFTNIEDSEDFLDIRGEVYKELSYALGSLSLVGACLVMTGYTTFFFFGVIDNKKDKIYVPQGGVGKVGPAFNPGIQCLQGSYMGQIIYLQGQELTMGTAPGVNLLFQDPYISQHHCSIRFNAVNGCYEILDTSTNGVYLSNGTRLRQGAYTTLPRGTVIVLGNGTQQFCLL